MVNVDYSYVDIGILRGFIKSWMLESGYYEDDSGFVRDVILRGKGYSIGDYYGKCCYCLDSFVLYTGGECGWRLGIWGKCVRYNYYNGGFMGDICDYIKGVNLNNGIWDGLIRPFSVDINVFIDLIDKFMSNLFFYKADFFNAECFGILIEELLFPINTRYSKIDRVLITKKRAIFLFFSFLYRFNYSGFVDVLIKGSDKDFYNLVVNIISDKVFMNKLGIKLGGNLISND